MLNQYAKLAKSSELILNLGRTVVDLLPPTKSEREEQLSLFPQPVEVSLFAEGLSRPSDIVFSRFVSPVFRARILKAWERLSPQLRHSLCSRGISVHAPATPFEYKSVFDDTLDAAAVFVPKTKAVIVPETHHWTSSALVPQYKVYTNFYHEIGHAIDFCFELSAHSSFQEAHKADRESENWNDALKKKYSYFLSSYDPVCETFAEAWAQKTLKKFHDLEPYDFQFEILFPRTWKWITANVPSADSGFFLPQETINRRDESGKTPIQILSPSIDAKEFSEVLSAGVHPLQTDKSGILLIDLYIGWHDMDKAYEMLIHLAKNFTPDDVQTIRANVGKWRKRLTNWVGFDAPEVTHAFDCLEGI